MRKILLTILAIVLMATSAKADVWDNVIGYIKAQETETGIYYSLDDKATHGYIGRTLAQDIFRKNIDLALAWDLKDAIGLEASYVIKEGTISPYIGLIVGTERIEKLQDNETGQGFIGISAGAKF